MDKFSLVSHICHEMEIFGVCISLSKPSNSRLLSGSTLLHYSQSKNFELKIVNEIKFTYKEGMLS
jgi:hypothetical protein